MKTKHFGHFHAVTYSGALLGNNGSSTPPTGV